MTKLNLFEILTDFALLNCKENIEIGFTGKIDSKEPNTLSFVGSRSFVDEASNNSNITHIVTEKSIAEEDFIGTNKKVIITENPKYDFYRIHNYLVRNQKHEENKIHSSVVFGTNVQIAPYGISIGKGTIIRPNVTILSGVNIGENCVVGPGSVLGNDSFECIRFEKEVLTVLHDGRVMVGNNVDLGSNVTVDKGLMKKNTIIGDYVKIDNQAHLSHNVEIGNRSLLAAGVIIAGNSSIGSDSWIGPGAVISNRIRIGNNSRISIGAVVVSDVEEGNTVSGNFAISHRKFMKNYIKSTL